MRLIDTLASMSPEDRDVALASIDPAILEYVRWDWSEFARPEQLPPSSHWNEWIYCSGRGSGKTRAAAEQVRKWAGDPRARVALIGPTSADVRDVMVMGVSGILAVCPPSDRPLYEPSKRRLTWPSGALAFLFSGEESSRLRGPNHSHIWFDEIATFKYDRECFDMAQMTLRLGDNPQAMYTTTPKPTKLMRELLQPKEGRHITTGSTFDNAENLPAAYIKALKERYEGTRIGQQELYAQMLEDIEGAVLKYSDIDDNRVMKAPEMDRVLVAIDPSVSSGEHSDSTGIIVVGRGEEYGHGYVLADRTLKGSPLEWAQAAIKAVHDFEAQGIIVEVNQGGDLVVANIRSVDPTVRVDTVHASKGKHIRFAPVGSLFEQGRIHHVGNFADLEQELCAFTLDGYAGDGSPDRADALTYGLTALLLQKRIQAVCF